MKLPYLIYICFYALGISAEHLTLHRPEDARSNLLFSQLPQYCGSVETEAELIATTNAAYALLNYMGPSIKLLPGYTGIFTGNCSIFFNSFVEEVACDINPATSQTLIAGSVIIPGTPLPNQYQEQITQSHILRANIFADWRGRKSQEFETDLHFKVSTYSSTESKSSLKTQSESLSTSQSISPTLKATQSFFSSISHSISLSSTLKATQSFVSTISHTLAMLSKTPMETISASYAALSATDSNSNTPSISSTDTGSSSKSTSGTLSKTQTLSLLLSKTATGVLSASTTRSQSGSLSKTTTESLTESSSLSRSTTISPSISLCALSTPPSTGLLAAWSKTGDTYTDTTNQTRRYFILNGTASDTLTGIQWEQNASIGTMNWTDAATYCAGRTTGGLSGWRAPNIGELQTLVDYTFAYLTVPINAVAFPNTPSVQFWASTPVEGNAGNSWLAYFSDYGYFNHAAITGANQVRCIRSCYSTPPSLRYTISSDLVTDTVTGLVWQRHAPIIGGPNNDGTYIHSDASNYCSTLNLGSFVSGWRLPATKELSTLVNYSVKIANLMMDITAFSEEPAREFWCSTRVSDSPSYAWNINFFDGQVGTYLRGNTYHVRCVH